MMLQLVLIAVGGFLGAISRFATITYVKKNWTTILPFGTLLVNLTGSFLLGLLYGLAVNSYILAFFGVGFMGAFTTFSTFMVEAISLIQAREKKQAILYLAFTYIGGILLAWIGIILASM